MFYYGKSTIYQVSRPTRNDEWHIKERHIETSMISLHLMADRPPFHELVEARYTKSYDNTAIYLCGPATMISSCMKAAGLLCQRSIQRMLRKISSSFRKKNEISSCLTCRQKIQSRFGLHCLLRLVCSLGIYTILYIYIYIHIYTATVPVSTILRAIIVAPSLYIYNRHY